MNEKLRKECRLLKALQGITYRELSELIEVKQDSFYAWLKGYYDFSEERCSHLKETLELIKEI